MTDIGISIWIQCTFLGLFAVAQVGLLVLERRYLRLLEQSFCEVADPELACWVPLSGRHTAYGRASRKSRRRMSDPK